MHRKFGVLFVLLLAFSLIPHKAEARRFHHTPHHVHHGAGVDAGAGYADLVIEADTGRVIHETDSNSLRHPASLTKMMTLYLTFQALEAGKLSLGQMLDVSENASYQSPSKLGLRAGQHIRVEDAILGLVTESANDAAVVLGETLGGSEEGMGQLMTRQAHALGMKQTVFHNPSGLPDPDQVTTAHDMALLGSALINHYPGFYPYFSHESFTYAGIYHHNHNHLMSRYDGMDGIKTGYIRASGFNLVASAKRNGVRLIGVVFGGRSAVARDNHMAQLLDASFTEALADNRAGRIALASGEGDSDGNDTNDYVTLPAKVSAIFPRRYVAGKNETIAAAPPAEPAADDQAKESEDGADDAAAAASDGKTAVVAADKPATAPVAAPPPVKSQQVASMMPPKAPPTTKTGSWGIQIGAYSDSAIGQQALSALSSSMPDMLNGAVPQVQKISASGAPMYRARFMSLDKKTAQKLCSYLIQRGKSCLTVEP